MNYATGSVTNANLLLDAFNSFITTTGGWTQNKKETVGSGQRAHYQKTASLGTMYMNLRSFIKETNWITNLAGSANYSQWDGIGGYLSKEYNGTLDWDKQVGRASSGNGTSYQTYASAALCRDSIVSYHFFQRSSPELVGIVIEWQIGYFTSLWFGEACKDGAGTYDGGIWYNGTSCNSLTPNTYPDATGEYSIMQRLFSVYGSSNKLCFLLDESSKHNGINGWLSSYPTTGSTSGTKVDNNPPFDYVYSAVWGSDPSYESGLHMPLKLISRWNAAATYQGPFGRSVNSATGWTYFFPVYFWWMNKTSWSTSTGPIFVHLGSAKDLYFVNMKDLNPKQVITIGSDEYIIIPQNYKKTPFKYYNDNGAYGLGYAIKKN